MSAQHAVSETSYLWDKFLYFLVRTLHRLHIWVVSVELSLEVACTVRISCRCVCVCIKSQS